MKIAINRCWGGFRLSEVAEEEMRKRGYTGEQILDFCSGNDRANPDLIAIIEQLGDVANSSFSNIVIVDIPADVDWYIRDYDGMETIEEKHRSWW